jgi:hypothetical protein
MSLVNITDREIEPKSIHFTDGGVFDPDPAVDTLQTADWATTVPSAPLADNAQYVVTLGTNFNTGHAYLISTNIAVNAYPQGGFGTTPTTFLNSWEVACYMGGQVIYSTIQHWTSINSQNSMATTNASMPSSFIIVVDTTRTLQMYLTCNSDTSSGSGIWTVNANPAYVVTGKTSYIDLGQVTIVQQGIPPVPPPQPIPPVTDPVSDLLITQGGIYTNLSGFVSQYVYPPF